MNCPRCNFRFGVLAIAGGTEVPELAPMICEGCTGLLLLVNGVPRIPTPEEQAAIERSLAFLEIIRALRARLLDTARDLRPCTVSYPVERRAHQGVEKPKLLQPLPHDKHLAAQDAGRQIFDLIRALKDDRGLCWQAALQTERKAGFLPNQDFMIMLRKVI